MNLLSGLEKFGLDQMDTDHLFEEEKSDTPATESTGTGAQKRTGSQRN